MTTQHRPVSVTRAGQGASASVAYGGDNWRDEAACREGALHWTAEAGEVRAMRFGFYGGMTPVDRYRADVAEVAA